MCYIIVQSGLFVTVGLQRFKVCLSNEERTGSFEVNAQLRIVGKCVLQFCTCKG